MDYETKTPSELWSLAWRGNVTDRDLYFLMSELILKYNKYPSGTFFPPKSGPFLLDLLERPHEPQLKIVVCTLIGYLCNVTSTAKEDLAKRGAIDLLLRIIEMGLPEKDDSAEVQLIRMLFEHVSSMLQFFSVGPDLCLRKMSVTVALGVIGQLTDTDNPTMFGYDAPSTLQKLVDGRLLVAERFDMTLTATSVVLYRQLGYDFKSRFHITDSYVLDLYDTNGDDDIRIVEELDKRSKLMMLYRSREEECEIEDVTKFVVVDVKATFCVSSAYFWAVLGHENIDMLSEFESELLDGSRFVGLGKTPSIGQMVGAAREDGSVVRGQVLLVGDDVVTVCAINYGFIKQKGSRESEATKFQVGFICQKNDGKASQEKESRRRSLLTSSFSSSSSEFEQRRYIKGQGSWRFLTDFVGTFVLILCLIGVSFAEEVDESKKTQGQICFLNFDVGFLLSVIHAFVLGISSSVGSKFFTRFAVVGKLDVCRFYVDHFIYNTVVLFQYPVPLIAVFWGWVENDHDHLFASIYSCFGWYDSVSLALLFSGIFHHLHLLIIHLDMNAWVLDISGCLLRIVLCLNIFYRPRIMAIEALMVSHAFETVLAFWKATRSLDLPDGLKSLSDICFKAFNWAKLCEITFYASSALWITTTDAMSMNEKLVSLGIYLGLSGFSVAVFFGHFWNS